MFWHEYAKIPRHTSQNPIAEGDFQWILTRNCEGTEQLRNIFHGNFINNYSNPLKCIILEDCYKTVAGFDTNNKEKNNGSDKRCICAG